MVLERRLGNAKYANCDNHTTLKYFSCKTRGTVQHSVLGGKQCPETDRNDVDVHDGLCFAREVCARTPSVPQCRCFDVAIFPCLIFPNSRQKRTKL